MNKFSDRWNHFWFRPAPPHIMAIFRIVFAAYLIIEALTYLPHVPALFSTDALTFSFWAPHAPAFIRPILELPPTSVAWVIAGVYLFACVALLVGIAMRTTLIALILLMAYYWQISFFLFPSSYHRIYLLVLCVLLISGADRTFSLRMLRTHGSIFAWEPISVFAQRLLSVQIAFTYVGVGMQKAWLPTWHDGRALSLSLVGRWATPLGRWMVALNLPFAFYTLLVDIIKVTEVCLPFMLWQKQWRWVAVLAGILFHVGIAVLMSIWWFIPLIPAYIVFWQPEEVYGWCKRHAGGRIR